MRKKEVAENLGSAGNNDFKDLLAGVLGAQGAVRAYRFPVKNVAY